MFTGFIRDITGARRARPRTSVSRRSFGPPTTRSSRGISSGLVTAWNHGAEILYGYSAQEAIGQPSRALIVPGEHDRGSRHRARSDLIRQAGGFEIERHRKSGERLIVSAALVRGSRPGAGKIIGISSVGHDITERKSREEREREDREATLWRERIEAALADDRFVFFSQPIVDLRTGSVDHQELLLRMELGGEIISPGRPLAARGEERAHQAQSTAGRCGAGSSSRRTGRLRSTSPAKPGRHRPQRLIGRGPRRSAVGREHHLRDHRDRRSSRPRRGRAPCRSAHRPRLRRRPRRLRYRVRLFHVSQAPSGHRAEDRHGVRAGLAEDPRISAL